MASIGALDQEIHETTRYLREKEHQRAAVLFSRPKSAAHEAEVKELDGHVEALEFVLQSLEKSKAACLTRMAELDVKIAGDLRVIELCRVDDDDD